MYQYTDFDRQFLRQRAAQFRDQLERWQRGELSESHFRPLRLHNGWYVQRHAPMLRVAVPYGELSSRQLRMLARIAREFDRQEAGTAAARGGFGHFTTRQNLQFNWIPLARAAEVMELLAAVEALGDVGQRAQLAHGQRAVRHGHAQHRRVALYVPAVLQAQRLELVLAQAAFQVPAQLVSVLGRARMHEGAIEFTVAVHGNGAEGVGDAVGSTHPAC